MRRATDAAMVAAAALGLAGCFHSTTVRIPHDTIARVERQVPDGAHLTLRSAEAGADVLAIDAREQAMCRDVESGQRIFTERTTLRKEHGHSGVGGLGNVDARVLLVAVPILILGGVVHAALPEEMTEETPVDEPPLTYREWRGPRAPCAEPSRPASALPLRVIARVDGGECLEWRPATAADGSVVLPAALTPGARTACERPVDRGCLWIEPADPALPGSPTPGDAAPHRTHEPLHLPLPPGLPGVGAGRARACSAARADPVEAPRVVAACAHLLRDRCRARLDRCLALPGDPDPCWRAARRCTRVPAFTACVDAGLRDATAP